MWQQILNFLNQGWVGSLLGILGILTGLYFYLASTKRKILKYQIYSEKLIEDFQNEVDGLKITYYAQPISNLAISHVYVWNAGRDVIRRNDISEFEPIEILVNGKLMGAIKLLSLRNGKNNGFLPERAEDKILINFSYIGHRDGFNIRFFHTWKDSIIVNVRGDVIGEQKPSRGDYYRLHKIFEAVFGFSAFILIAFILPSFSLVSVQVLVFEIFDISDGVSNSPSSPEFSLLHFFITYSFLIVGLIYFFLVLPRLDRFLSSNENMIRLRKKAVIFFARLFGH
ncbi:hypothetical protein IQ265_11645 [Nodosilinea sp. LEGE 06152]|uniref:hypothetical protein n=1 Tax=Nodosilinea sp. LEGE 06152 TaxID=2777966 RepID=UPI0018808BE5|nr:hypothetical protein [Nodosilinea sp. LEGE 06152]MBE9157471.1 hypothetical protein [Nodosilinea sp. LEGE 06152]